MLYFCTINHGNFPFFSKDVIRLWIYELGNPGISAYIIRQALSIVNCNPFAIDTKILFFPIFFLSLSLATEFPGQENTIFSRYCVAKLFFALYDIEII